jgi:hypothetical protein
MVSQETDDGSRGPRDLPKYLGPYEYWNFGPGKGYAFPAMRHHPKYLTAFDKYRLTRRGEELDLPGTETTQPVNSWPPTLWKVPGWTFAPFVIEQQIDLVRDLEDLQKVLRRGLTEALRGSVGPRVALPYSRFRLAYPVPDRSMHAELPPGSGPCDPDRWKPDEGLCERIGKDKRITLVAVIDDGLPFAHRNFRDKSGCRSRVEFCWLQSVAIDVGEPTVLFGREYIREQIEELIAQHGDDEDTLYRVAGAMADSDEYGSLLAQHGTHGAHVMDLATGYAAERGDDPPEEIRIIAVQLPNMVTVDTSSFGKDAYILSAFHYIFHRADIIANCYDIKNLRLVINFSYGYSGGRHDGESDLEAAIDELVRKRREHRGPTALVLGAGNTFLDRMHGTICDDDFQQGVATLPWRVQPNDRTSNYLELWFPREFNPWGFTIELWDPWGRLRVSVPVDRERVFPLLTDDGNVIGELSADVHRAGAGNPAAEGKENRGTMPRWRVVVVLAPTEPENDSLPGAEAGKWTVAIKRDENAQPLGGPIHCWVQRATDIEVFRSGSRQSYFDDPADLRYTEGRDFEEEEAEDVFDTGGGDLNEADTEKAFVRRFGSLNGIATGSTSLVVAGYRLGAGLCSSLKRARPSRYSSAGWPYNKEKQVDCSSMSDRSRVLPGTIAAGVRSGSLSFVQGTSAAAPFVARQLATIFTTADDQTVAGAEYGNYLSLLRGYWDTGENLTRARLGAVRVPPHWQPGIDPDCLEDAALSPATIGE